jgi:hypothetical protein
MRLSTPATAASWIHRDARAGFEVAFVSETSTGHRLTGHTTANESNRPWSVGYEVETDSAWRTLTVAASNLTEAGTRALSMTRTTGDRWTVNGEPRHDLDGCVDVDFESSAVTNTLPIHRLDFTAGVVVDAPTAFVRAEDLRVERIEQTYTLIERAAERLRFHYESPTFDFSCELEYDLGGLVVEYPGIATREY